MLLCTVLTIIKMVSRDSVPLISDDLMVLRLVRNGLGSNNFIIVPYVRSYLSPALSAAECLHLPFFVCRLGCWLRLPSCDILRIFKLKSWYSDSLSLDP